MHPYLLNLIYAMLVLFVSPWLLFQAAFRNKYRTGWRDKLLGCRVKPAHDSRRIWLHAVSVGEVNLLEPIVQRLKKQVPDAELVISTTTRTGFDLARNKYRDLQVFYCPLDFSWSVQNTLSQVKPDLLVLAELEIWPNLIRYCKRRSIAITVINGRLSEKSYRGYTRFSWLVKRTFSDLDFVGVQNEEYARRFIDAGVSPDSVTVTGSVKFDGAITDRENARTKELAELAGITAEDVIFLAGSTQDPEEQYALNIFKEFQHLHGNLKLFIVPRHPERFEVVANLLDQSGVQWQRRSRLIQGEPSSRVLLIDTIGELSAWWGTAQIALVGGSFGNRGGQNMIEPAAYGAAVSFGPHTSNFRDIAESLLTADAAVRVRSEAELRSFVDNCIANCDFRNQFGHRARQVVIKQQGAADRTVANLVMLLNHAHLNARQVA